MKKFLYLIGIIFIITVNSYSQNLVNNPSFEDIKTCPNDWFDFHVLEHCFHVLRGSSDVFNSCYTNTSLLNAGVPSNKFGHQYPRTGEGYVGQCFIDLVIDLSDTTFLESDILCEQFGMTLKEELVENKKYCVNFYVSLANRHSTIATDAISMLILSDSLPLVYFSPPEDTIYSNFPQIMHPQINNPYGNIIKDTINWVKIEGEFIAQGGEKYLYISNFKRLGDINWDFVPYTDYFNGSYSYYYIDDVSVYLCDAPVYYANAGNDTCISAGESVVLGNPSLEEYLYWWSDGKRIIGNSGSITVKPTKTTTYYLRQKDFKFEESIDSVTVEVGDCLPIAGNGALFFRIYPNPNDGNFQIRFNGLIPEGAKLQLFDILGRQVGEYLLVGDGNIANIQL